jgi:hypothetical protein
MKESLYSWSDLVEVAKEILFRQKRGKTKGSLSLHGEWCVEHKRGELWLPSIEGKNRIVTQGLNTFLNVTLGSTAKYTSWYVAIFKNNATITANDVLSSVVGDSAYNECQDADYTPNTNRPQYVPADTTTAVITNAANKAEFNIINNITVYGAFIASSQAKRSTSGVLLAAKKFDTARTVVNGDVLYVTYQITAESS